MDCGCDEAGRGSGAAEIFVAAVILNPSHPIPELADSKSLTSRKRESLSAEIKRHALNWRIERAGTDEIEKFNVLHATLRAMKRAVERLKIRPDRVLVDGNHAPKMSIPVVAIVKGDAKVPEISAASILAKVARDHAMSRYHDLYPEYGFNVHKGYFTREHMNALKRFGPCPIHRRTYSPIRVLLETESRDQLSIFTGEEPLLGGATKSDELDVER